MASTLVSGAASHDASSLAPEAATVLSMMPSRLPLRSPASVRVSSKLRRVAASISMTAPLSRRRIREIRGTRPFWVSAM